MNRQEAFLKDASKLFENVPSFYGAYTDFLTKMMQDNFKIASDIYAKMPQMTMPAFGKKQDGCCPPEKTCPPRCLAEIMREACVGEVIVVPFRIKNKCGPARDYKVGLRPLVDQNGTAAPVQPTLNTDSVHLEPGQAITVLMTVNLMQGYEAGSDYATDIVIREESVNQNVCFKLHVKSCNDGVQVCPLDEKEYFLHWQGWQDHFYCEQKPSATTNNPGVKG